eukprot:sb/3464609/
MQQNVLKYTSVIDELLGQYEVEARQREGENDGHFDETCALWDQATTVSYAQIEQSEAARRRREEEEARGRRDAKLALEYKKKREEQLEKYEREVEEKMREEARREREREVERRLKLERIQVEHERQCRAAEQEDEKRRAESIEYTLTMELEDGQSIEDFKAAQEAEMRKYEQDRGEKGVWDDLFAELTISQPQQDGLRSSPPSRSFQPVTQPTYNQPGLQHESPLPLQDLWGVLPPKTTTTIAHSGSSCSGSISPSIGYSFNSPASTSPPLVNPVSTNTAVHNSPPFVTPTPVSTNTAANNSPPLTPMVPTAKHHRAATAGGTAQKPKLLPPSAFLSSPAVATNVQYVKPPSPPSGGLPTPGLASSTTTPPGIVAKQYTTTTDSYSHYNMAEEALPRRPRKVAKGRGKATLSSSGSTSSGSSSPPPPGFEPGSPRYKVNVGYGGVVQGWCK